MSLRPRQRVAVLVAAALLGAAFEIVLTGGTLDAPLDRLAIYYATAIPWATILTILFQFYVVTTGGLPPEWCEPVIIGIAGGIQGGLVAGVVLLLLIAFSWRRDPN